MLEVMRVTGTATVSCFAKVALRMRVSISAMVSLVAIKNLSRLSKGHTDGFEEGAPLFVRIGGSNDGNI